ncbi:MAG TPA: type II toxin-antitoxin system death-on-curing family toxin [Candidatus Saccharicenans sp.]|nr:type II toxin-antitoxin system death-on-curing family toxin [Candidatus Saccharicenans sp.]HQE65017.1 type II toxin-antitoxin system death-on-curing family toxin [Candidatus Saccharicenans sp.]HQH61740.1 type II toxin-antitoxin system death-on-curing family toxin [Candidatus Saccharicenans sp.]HQI23024.1 type II toxin-antitoxin system death-on-curing family toxin [Candidatus Saccharicenans sp.]
METISVQEVEYIAYRLAREMLSFDEPIPDFSSRFPDILESCLAVPFQSFSRKQLYPGLISKASILFYLLIKNHPFQNGNKRIAITTLFVFLYKNKKWIKVDTQELYNFAVWVAQSPAKVKDETVMAIEKFLKTYLVSA